MSWTKMGQAFRDLRSTGPRGFEGVLARILEEVLATPFDLARAGDQPTGDARSRVGATVMQAKRYSRETHLNENEIVGEIHKILDSVERLDLYVLGVTKSTSQIQSRLEEEANKTGLDIFCLTYDEGRSSNTVPDLGALCILHWDAINETPVESDCCRETVSLKQHFARHEVGECWIAQQRSNKKVLDTANRLQDAILGQVQTYESIRELSLSYLQKRFFLKTGLRNRYPIDLTQVVPRKKSLEKLQEWWKNDSAVTAYIEGEEGVGKSWLAANLAWDLVEKQNSLCLWLESEDWENCRSLKELVSSALRRIGVSEEAKLERLSRKALSRWKRPILLMLDGVNERRALEAAVRVLDSFQLSKPLAHLRVLFTTRHLAGYRSYGDSFWSGSHRIELGPFDNSEMDEALRREGLDKGDFSEALLSIARIPRYFTLCLSLRSQLGNLSHVSRELVLWEDLKLKIKQADLQVHDSLGLRSTEDADEVLSMLAKKAQFDQMGKSASVTKDILRDCFESEYESIRIDLAEQRIASSHGRFGVTLSSDHIMLGWALLLRGSIYKCKAKDLYGLVDSLLKLLEPIPSEDRRIAGLFVAVCLSILDTETSASHLSMRRAALMSAWYDSHNMIPVSGGTEMLAEKDLTAYTLFAQYVFETIRSAQSELAVIEPLAKMWKEGRHRDELHSLIERWLLLAWKPDDENADVDVEYEGIKLTKARTEPQLRLSAAAVSILSQRADPDVLGTLAWALTTQSVSMRENERGTIRLKRCEDNIGLLMRWCYTEQSLDSLVRLANESTPDSPFADGLRKLTWLLRLAEPPPLLQHPVPNTVDIHFRDEELRNALRTGTPILTYPVDKLAESNLEIENLAVRLDYDGPAPSDAIKMKDTLRYILEQKRPHSVVGRLAEDCSYDSFSVWTARCYPLEYAEIMGEALLKALEYDNPYYFFARHLSSTIALWNSQQEALFFERAEGTLLASANVQSSDTSGRYILPMCFTQVAALNLSAQRLGAWISKVAEHAAIRETIFLNDLPQILSETCSAELCNEAERKTKNLAREFAKGDASKTAEFEFWCYLWAVLTPDDEETCEWAENQLSTRGLQLSTRQKLAALFVSSIPAERWPNVLKDTNSRATLRLINAENRRLLAYYARHPLEALHADKEELEAMLPSHLVGRILQLRNRYDELDSWGRSLWQRVDELGSRLATQTVPAVRISVELGTNHTLCLFHPESESRSSYPLGRGTGDWGVDYPGIEDLKKKLSGVPDPNDVRYRSFSDAIDEADSAETGDLLQFADPRPLSAWASRNPGEFIEYATKHFRRVRENPAEHWLWGAFTDSVICAMLRVDPSKALTFWIEQEQCEFKANAVNMYGVPAFAYELWAKEIDNLAGVSDARRGIFERCRNDEQIMLVALAALASHRQRELMKMLETEFLSEPIARQRCLAVSILPWIADQESLEKLRVLESEDPNVWLREHARWAIEVLQQERSCREVYREALLSGDARRVSATFHRLKPALLPSARVWRQEIEAESRFWKICNDGRIRALVHAFWGEHARTNHNTRVAFRRLNEYCRGDKIDERRCARIWPWWQI